MRNRCRGVPDEYVILTPNRIFHVDPAETAERLFAVLDAGLRELLRSIPESRQLASLDSGLNGSPDEEVVPAGARLFASGAANDSVPLAEHAGMVNDNCVTGSTPMSDGFTFAALGGVAAAEGIKFLYEQAAELLKAWRERRKHTPGDEGEPPELPVPIIGSPALDGQQAQHPADAALVADYYQALITLSGALSPYAQGLADIESGGTALANQAERLRAVLEEIYHQRFTFRGEQREPSEIKGRRAAAFRRRRRHSPRGTCRCRARR